MDKQQQDFDSRLKRIDRRHRRISDGYVTTVNNDGLIVAVPRRRVRVPFAGIAMVAIGVIVFKGIVHAHLGATDYDARIAALASGSQVERVGAWVMQADPLTVWMSDRARQIID